MRFIPSNKTPEPTRGLARDSHDPSPLHPSPSFAPRGSSLTLGKINEASLEFRASGFFVFYGVSAAAFNAAFLLAIITGKVDVSPGFAGDPRAFWIYVVSIGAMTVGIDLWLLRIWWRFRRRKKDA